ncbi:DUF1294 domain-containing protein [Shewanella sp. C32]|uniref:DUF1294 domain-containing protein n=1 Tax=Shewanella electrica TaxID=515560 RepID=A0ABT2FFD1_9GAMM|nr:DUF1294 domain-containing protein [Shewanella electrica]MCH1925110.1 DUF1294 domain-containing protein [Shewanella electrica]MCS4554934.1 DUF1294 domain-containing protein [Shewanella electrica]
MKGKGHLSQWNDDRGFGFITPVNGDKPVFLHIKAMANRSRRPTVGELLSYELAQDKQGRWQALNAMSTNDKQQLRQQNKRNKQYQRQRGTAKYSLLFLLLLALASWQHWLPKYTPVWYLALSVISYISYALDKRAAQQDRWRISESTLQLQALLGGWPGALLAQQRLRHKSVKTAFRRVFWVMLLLNLAALFALYHYRHALPALLY